jgi:hypothetical protein
MGVGSEAIGLRVARAGHHGIQEGRQQDMEPSGPRAETLLASRHSISHPIAPRSISSISPGPAPQPSFGLHYPQLLAPTLAQLPRRRVIGGPWKPPAR